MTISLPARTLARYLAGNPDTLPEALPLPASGACWSGVLRGALRRPPRRGEARLDGARLLLLAAGRDGDGRLRTQARDAGIPVLDSPLPPALLRRRQNRFLAQRLRVVRPGTLLRLGDRGLLLTGPAGSGKSDLALELLERGHALVSDDAVALARTEAGRLLGRCPVAGPPRLGLRDLGLVEPERLFGPRASAAASEVDLWIELAPEPGSNALEGRWRRDWLLGARLPRLTLGGAGRPRALLVESALRTLAGDRGRRGLRSYVARQRSCLAGAPRRVAADRWQADD